MPLRPRRAGSRPAGAWTPGPAATRPARRPLAHFGVAAQAGPVRPGRIGPGPMRQGVRVAVDVGSVRVGVARSDPGGILASPLAVVRSGPGDLDELARLAGDAIEVIVGLPTSLSGREGAAAAAARRFAADLAARLAPVPVRLVDER